MGGISLEKNDVQLELQIASYTLSLLSLRDMHPSVLDMAFEVLPKNAAQDIFENIRKEKPSLLDSFLGNKDKQFNRRVEFNQKLNELKLEFEELKR